MRTSARSKGIKGDQVGVTDRWEIGGGAQRLALPAAPGTTGVMC